MIETDRQHVLACKRLPVEKIRRIVDIPARYFEALEHNQQIASCCRHPENHDLEAFYSSPADRDKGVPDIYKFHCSCGRTHTRFCVGGGDQRPFWDIR